jgi:tRNA (guanine37-N1)-methyltransferase
MVMRPEPWGEALDALATDGAVLVVPTPSGEPFTQALATELATVEHLVFACGRYEGIDHRVLDEAASRGRVTEVSLGDYVVNGGEVAVLYCFVFLYIASRGSGAWSVDAATAGAPSTAPRRR